MRLLLLNHNLLGCGTWHRAWHLARELARRGHQVTLWTAAPHHYYRPVHERTDGVAILKTPSWAPLAGADDGWGPLDIAYRTLRILTERFDLCYAFAHPPTVSWPAWLAHRLRRRPLLYDWCDWYEGGIFPKREALRRLGLIPPGEPWMQVRAERWDVALERRMVRLADRLTVISERIRELALEAGRREQDLLLLPNGANLEGIRPLDPVACRKQLNLPDEGRYVGYLSNYHPDQELLLRGLARAAESIPGLRLLKTGPPFGERLVRELGLRDRIVDFGFVDASIVPTVLGASEVLALPLEDNPSNRARVPFKFTDYLAAGRPIVTCRVGDIARWFDEAPQPFGFAGAPNVQAFGDALRQALDPATDRRALGAAARRFAEDRFAWSDLTDRLESFIADWL